jgi:hypothetical protein
MAQQPEFGPKPNETEIRQELLKKSAALKEKSTLLKARMEATAHACEDFLHHQVEERTGDNTEKLNSNGL